MDPRIKYKDFKLENIFENDNTSECYPKNLMKGVDNKLPEIWDSNLFKYKNNGTISSCMIKEILLRK